MVAAITHSTLPIDVVYGQEELKQGDLEQAVRTALRVHGFEEWSQVEDRLIKFDLTASYWYDLGATLWFITLLNTLKRQRNELQLLLPEAEGKGRRLWSFLLRWRFFTALAERVEEPINLLAPQQVRHLNDESIYGFATGHDPYGTNVILHTARLLEIHTFGVKNRTAQGDWQDEFLNRFSNQVVLTALAQPCGWDFKIARRFANEVVGEGLRNSTLHGRGSFVAIAMRLDAKNLTLAIADNGIGIPETLRQAFKEGLLKAPADLINDPSRDAELIHYFTEPKFVVDSRLITLSVRPGVTSASDRSGFGLHYLKSCVLEHGGELRIRSGTAQVDFSSKGDQKDETKDDLASSPGTLIRIRTPLRQVSRK